MNGQTLFGAVLLTGVAGFAYYMYRKGNTVSLATPAGGQAISQAVSALPITSRPPNSLPYTPISPGSAPVGYMPTRILEDGPPRLAIPSRVPTSPIAPASFTNGAARTAVGGNSLSKFYTLSA